MGTQGDTRMTPTPPPVREGDRALARELCPYGDGLHADRDCGVCRDFAEALSRVRAESQLVPSIEDRDWCRQMFSASDHSDGCLICAKLTTVRAEAEAKERERCAQVALDTSCLWNHGDQANTEHRVRDRMAQAEKIAIRIRALATRGPGRE